MNKSFFTLFLLFLCYTASAQTKKKHKVLFIGNSYTYVNNLPQIIYDIALANGDTLVFDSNCPGGYTFKNHFLNATSVAKIKSQKWDYVVLQAQSQEPSFSLTQVASETLPYAIKLDSIVKQNDSCTKTVFYETWGRKNGDAGNCPFYTPVCTYEGMQNRLKQSYKLFADTCKALMSPCGEAWRKSIATNPTLELYQTDQSHPSAEGSYLSACVFYEMLFNKSVLGNTYRFNIDSATASNLQKIAHAVVNDSISVWNIGAFLSCGQTLPTSINNMQEAQSHILFPNPSKGIITFKTNNENEKYIEVYSIMGNLIYSLSTNNLQVNIDLTQQNKGIYFIKITEKNKIITTKKIVLD